MLAERIKSLRKEKGLSLEQLAEAVGTSRQTIHRYENGIITNIPSEKVEGLAKALGTTPSALMGWVEDDDFFSSFNNITPLGNAKECISSVSEKKLPMLGNVACGEPIFA